MKTLAAILLTVSVSAQATAFLKHQYVSGMNRVCVYNQMGSDLVITIKSYELCPLTL